MSVGGVYKITHTDGRIYIGSTYDMVKRCREHRLMLAAGKHSSRKLQDAYDASGKESLTFEMLLICDRSNLLMYEEMAIAAYKPEFNVLRKYKKAKKGDSKKYSSESISRLKKYLAGDKTAIQEEKERVRILAVQRGATIFTEEVRAKLSAAAIAREARKREAINGQE